MGTSVCTEGEGRSPLVSFTHTTTLISLWCWLSLSIPLPPFYFSPHFSSSKNCMATILFKARILLYIL
ncbi:hypothetical protein FKM82_019396 [Ascaphus truei]